MTLNLPLFYFTYFTMVFVLSILMNSLFLRFSRTLGIRKDENIIRWSDVTKPAIGGITFYITFLLSLIVYSLFFAQTAVLLHSETLGLLAACTIAFLMGLADDAYDTNPILKFSTQVFCAIILIYSGIYIQLFQNVYFNYLITIYGYPRRYCNHHICNAYRACHYICVSYSYAGKRFLYMRLPVV